MRPPNFLQAEYARGRIFSHERQLLTAAGGLALVIWLYLFFFRGGFWRVGESLDNAAADLPNWPSVAAIVPARNEADVVGPVIRSLHNLDYPGRLRIILVNDASTDGTGAVAQAVIDDLGLGRSPDNVSVEMMDAKPLQAGWAGKLWAMSCGVGRADESEVTPDYYLFCDADIVHEQNVLRRLTAKADRDDLDMVSQMVQLTVQRFWERLLIPAFVFFFAKLYPFAWVNSGHISGRQPIAAAAGGCMLVSRSALQNAGGLAQIRAQIIDDCALARLLRKKGRPGGGRPGGGRLWLGWTRQSRSIRPYDGIGGIWQMVSRSAYTQLRYSPILLVGTVLGMCLVYLVGPALAIGYLVHGQTLAALLGAVAYGLSALCFLPHLILYRTWWALAALIPVAGLLYTLMTIGSAIAYYRGRGGAWKGRIGSAAGILSKK